MVGFGVGGLIGGDGTYWNYGIDASLLLLVGEHAVLGAQVGVLKSRAEVDIDFSTGSHDELTLTTTGAYGGLTAGYRF